MGILKRTKEKFNAGENSQDDKSIYVHNVRIDKNGETWQRKAFWIREKHLGKLKVIAHFQGKAMQDVLDTAIESYIKDHWDSTSAMKKLVGKSPGKH